MTALYILFVFLLFAALMISRKMPALLAVPLMAVLIALGVELPYLNIGDGVEGFIGNLPGVTTAIKNILTNVISAGAIKLAPAYMAVVAGAMLGRVMIQTGIAEGIIKKAAEFGGEKPLVVSIFLMFITAVLFTSLTGLGAIIMVGSLVLPIMMSLGVPRRLAGTFFLLAFATGFIFNISLLQFYREILGVVGDGLPPEVFHFQLLLLGIMSLGVAAYVFYTSRKTLELKFMKGGILGEGKAKSSEPPAIAYLTPLIPLILYFGFSQYGWTAIPAFIAGSVFAVVVTDIRKSIQNLVASMIKGVEDAAPAVILMVGIGMLINALQLPGVKGALMPVFSNLPIGNSLSFVTFFFILSPLALYRGPFNLFGLGAGLFALIVSGGGAPPLAVLSVAMTLVQMQNVCDPTNTHNVWIANSVGVPVEDLTKSTFLTMVAICLAGLATGAFLFIP